jgi:hypothetical protein
VRYHSENWEPRVRLGRSPRHRNRPCSRQQREGEKQRRRSTRDDVSAHGRSFCSNFQPCRQRKACRRREGRLSQSMLGSKISVAGRRRGNFQPTVSNRAIQDRWRSTDADSTPSTHSCTKLSITNRARHWVEKKITDLDQALSQF